MQQTFGNNSIEYDRSTVMTGVGRDNALHHIDEGGLLRSTQVLQRGAVRGPRRCLDSSQKCCSRRGQFAETRATVLVIDGSLDKIASGQPLERSGRRRPVQRDIGCQRGLIGGFPYCERRKQAVLQRRHLEFSARFLKQRDVNLMQPPDQKARPF